MDIYKLIQNYKWSKDKPSPKNSITTVELFSLCVELRQTKLVAERLGVNEGTVSRWLKSYTELDNSKRIMAVHKVSSVFELKQCSDCLEFLPFSFYTEGQGGEAFGLQATCKSCRHDKDQIPENKERKRKTLREWRNKTGAGRFHCAKRRAAILQRTPAWADQEKIKEIYSNCPEGYQVDHILPLQGELVSGLHVPENLQYLTKSENSIKNNKFVPG